MNRYQSDIRIDTTKQIPYYETTLLNSVPGEVIPFYYVARGNERLDNISNLFYRTPKNWWVIAKANRLANGTISVPNGTTLFIPNI